MLLIMGIEVLLLFIIYYLLFIIYKEQEDGETIYEVESNVKNNIYDL